MISYRTETRSRRKDVDIGWRHGRRFAEEFPAALVGGEQRIDLAEQRGIGAGGSAEPLQGAPGWLFQRLLEQRLDTDPPDAPFL